MIAFLMFSSIAQAAKSPKAAWTKASKSMKADDVINTLSACIDRYPGYLGPLDLSGSSVTITFTEGDSGEDMMLFEHNLMGAEASCDGCGIHIHTGTTCDNAALVLGHYWDKEKTDDLWTSAGGAVYNSSPSGESVGSFMLTNGYGVEDNAGHAVVVHDSDGARYGCGVLSSAISTRAAKKLVRKDCKKPKKPKKIVLETCVEKYPDYDGTLDISGKIRAKFKDSSDTKITMQYDLSGADPDCVTCGLHIHSGTTCDVAGEVGGHYWTDVDDPWTTAGGSIYPSTSNGEAKGKFMVDAGYNAMMNDGHAVVVHDKEGVRYGCGVLSASKKENCN
jgi:hypothetical protein